MGYQPWYSHQTYPAIQIPLNLETNPDNIAALTPSSFSMVIRNVGVSPNVDTNGTGVFLIVTTNPAVVSYQFSDADTVAGNSVQLFVEAVFPGVGGGKAVYDPIPFVFTGS